MRRSLTGSLVRRLRFSRVLRAEYAKFFGLVSNVWLLVGMVVLAVAVCLLTTGLALQRYTDLAHVDPVAVASGSQVLLEILAMGGGALIVGREYSRHTTSALFAAVPRRWPALCAQILVVASLACVTGAAAAITSSTSATFILRTVGSEVTYFSPEVVDFVWGQAVALALLAAFAAALTGLVRNLTVGVLLSLAIVLIGSQIAAMVVQSAGTDASAPLYSIHTAARVLAVGGPGERWIAAAVMIAWLLTAAVPTVILLARDAKVSGREHVRSAQAPDAAAQSSAPAVLDTLAARGTSARRGAADRARAEPRASVRWCVTLGSVVRAELYKLLTSRAGWWLLGIMVVGVIAAGTWQSAGVTPEDVYHGMSPELTAAEVVRAGAIETTVRTTSGINGFANILVAVFGAYAVVSDYASGTTKSLYAAVPRRWQVALGKLMAVALGATVSSLVTLTAVRLSIMPIQRNNGFDVAITDEAGINAVLTGTAYLVLVALIGCGVGFLIRSTASTLLTIATIFVFVPGLTSAVGAGSPETDSGLLIYNLRLLFPGVGWSSLYSGGGSAGSADPGILHFMDNGVLQTSQLQASLIVVAWTVLILAAVFVVLRRAPAARS